MPTWIREEVAKRSPNPDAEFERRVRDETNRRVDERVAEMANGDGERLAILETEMRHTREALEDARKEQAKLMQGIMALQGDVQKLNDVLTKASGIKLAFMVFVGGLGFALSQFWNFMNWK